MFQREMYLHLIMAIMLITVTIALPNCFQSNYYSANDKNINKYDLEKFGKIIDKLLESYETNNTVEKSRIIKQLQRYDFHKFTIKSGSNQTTIVSI